MSKTIISEYDLSFIPLPNESHVLLDDRQPPTELTTSALGLVFFEEQLVLPKLVERGWDIPGGHIEKGETPEETFRREVHEEVAATLSECGPLGYQQIILHAPKPDGYKYPYPTSSQAFFWGRVDTLEPFEPTFEVLERGLFLPAQAKTVKWVKRFEPLYRAALEEVRLSI